MSSNVYYSCEGIEVGQVIYQKTCDEIRMSLDGKITEVNPREEPWVILDIDVSSQRFNLFNLQNQRKYKMYFKEFEYLLKIKRIRISSEVA